jgi:plasmid maintenance system antidote protein VapI
MIVSYRDNRTRDFAAGKRVKAFSAIERAAELARRWLNLQSLYELRVAEQRVGKAIRALPRLRRRRGREARQPAHA